MSERMEGNAKEHRGFMRELRIVQVLADRMLDQLKANRHKGHWGREDVMWLLERAQEELDELKDAIILRYDDSAPSAEVANAIAREAADVANFLAMIIDNTRPPA